jgi:DNA-binding FadR family transcriptional regulator
VPRASPSSRVASSAGVYRGRGPRAAALVAAYLRGQIVRGEIREGDALPSEAVLMEQFGVSRPTLREALRVLESEGLLTVNRGSLGGFPVHTPNGEVAARFAGQVLQNRGATLADVLQACSVVEPQCAKMLAQHRTSTDLDRLRECLEAGEHEITSVGPQRGSAHAAFHELVVELSGNQTLMLVAGMLRHIVDQADPKLITNPETSASRQHLRRAQKEHRQLVELIESGDHQAAEQMWTRHLIRNDHQADAEGALVLLP